MSAEWDKPTPSGHIYRQPMNLGELRQQATNYAQGIIESWAEDEMPPQPTWSTVGIALTAIMELEHTITKMTQAQCHHRYFIDGPDECYLCGFREKP